MMEHSNRLKQALCFSCDEVSTCFQLIHWDSRRLIFKSLWGMKLLAPDVFLAKILLNFHYEKALYLYKYRYEPSNRHKLTLFFLGYGYMFSITEECLLRGWRLPRKRTIYSKIVLWNFFKHNSFDVPSFCRQNIFVISVSLCTLLKKLIKIFIA